MSDDNVQVQFGATTTDLESGVDRVKGKISEVGQGVQEFASSLKEIGAVVLEAFAVEKLVEFVKSMAELGTQVERTAAILGISTKEVGEFNLIAAVSGTSADGMTHALERLQVNLGKAGDAASPAGQALKALGLTQKELVGIPIPEQMNKIAEGLSKYADGGNKTAIAIALLGRAGAEMIPTLDKGKAGLDEIRQSAADAAVSLSGPTTEALHGVHAASATLGAALQSLGAAIVGSFSNSLITGAHAMTDVVAAFNALTQAGSLWQATLREIQFTWDFWIAGMRQNAVFLKDLFTLNWGAIKSDWQKGNDDLQAVATDHWNEMLRQAGIAKLKLAAALNMKDEDSKSQAPGIGGDNGASALAVAQAAMDGEIKVMQQGLATKKLLLEQEFAAHKITKSQELQSTQDYVDDTYGTSREILTDEMNLYDKGTKEYQTALNKRNELDEKYATDSAKITLEATKAQEKSYTDMSNSIQSMFNSQLRGLLAGTTSWSQAFKNIMGDLVIKFIEMCEKMAVEWVIKQVMMTSANATQAAARSATEVASQSATLPERAAKYISDITASAGATFAGVMANLSPAMGPAAVGPAAAMQATALGQLANVPKLAVGTPWVQADGLAFLHRGEQVLTAAQVAAPGGGAGSGTHFHLGGLTINGSITSTELKGHIRTIAKGLQDHWMNNPSTRPAY